MSESRVVAWVHRHRFTIAMLLVLGFVALPAVALVAPAIATPMGVALLGLAIVNSCLQNLPLPTDHDRRRHEREA